MKRTDDQLIRNKIFIYDDNVDNNQECQDYQEFQDFHECHDFQNYSNVPADHDIFEILDILDILECTPKILITFYFDNKPDDHINVFNTIEDLIPRVVGAYVTIR